MLTNALLGHQMLFLVCFTYFPSQETLYWVFSNHFLILERFDYEINQCSSYRYTDLATATMIYGGTLAVSPQNYL